MHFSDYVNDPVRELFGFPTPKPINKQETGDTPIRPFGRDKLMSELSKHKVGSVFGESSMGTNVKWGTGVGAVRIHMSPNHLITVDRLTDDLEGNPSWVIKKSAKVRYEEYAGRESVVAREVLDEVNLVAESQIDSASEDCDLERIVRRTKYMTERLTGVFRLEEVIKDGPHRRTLQFGVTNYGVGQLVSQDTPGGILAAYIEVAFLPKRGLIKGTFATVTVDERSNAATIQVPYFVGFFAPSQNPQEIAQVLTNGVRFT